MSEAVCLRRWPLLLVCLVFALYASPLWASGLVLPVQGTNLKVAEVDAIWQLVATAYQAQRADGVPTRMETEAALEQMKSAPAAAAQLGAAEYIHVSAVRLRQRIVIAGSLHGADGALLHTAKITALSMDDVEPASERLVQALVRRTATEQSRDLETITSAEAASKNRTSVHKSWGVEAAFTYPVAYGHELAPMLSAGVYKHFEGTRHFIELAGGFFIPEGFSEHDLSYGGVYGDFGANWYLAQNDTSVYLGAGVMPRLASAAVTNIAPYAQAGIMLFRESTSRLHADLRVAQNVLAVGFHEGGGEVDPASGVYPIERERRLYPTELTLSVGVGF